MCPVLPISCSSISLSPGVHSFKLTPPSRVLLKSLAVAIRPRTRSSYIPKISRLQTFRFVSQTSHFPERGVSILHSASVTKSDNVKYDLDEWTIVSTLSSPHHESFNIPVQLQEETINPYSIPLSAFINSGAMGNFIHPHTITTHNLPMLPWPKPLLLQTVTGKIFHKVNQQV